MTDWLTRCMAVTCSNSDVASLAVESLAAWLALVSLYGHVSLLKLILNCRLNQLSADLINDDVRWAGP